MNGAADLATQSRPILVIGGGVIGLCCTYSLRVAGIPVVLCEQSSYGSGASSGNLGLLAVSHSLPLASPGVVSQALRWLGRSNSPLKIEYPPDFELLRWLWRFYRASTSARFTARAGALTRMCLESVELFRDLERRLSLELLCKGTLEVFATARTFRHFRSGLKSMQTAGIAVETLNAADLRVLSPRVNANMAGGAFYSADCCLDPSRFIAAMTARLLEMDVAMHVSSGVRRLVIRGRQVVAVELKDRVLEVSGVVLAAGYESNVLLQPLGMKLPIQAGRGYTVDFADGLSCVDTPTMFAEARLLATPLGDRLRIGGYLHLGTPGSGKAVRQVTLEQLMHPLRDYFDESVLQELSRCAAPLWSGSRPCSSDGLPIIGTVSQFPNLLIATGHGMLGLTLGPITGKLIAGLLQGERDTPLLSPDRFT